MNPLLSLALVLLAFGFGVAPQARAGVAQKFQGALPAIVEGTLVIDVAADEVEENAERVAFGTLTVAGKEYAVEVPEALASKVPAKGGGVRVTLGAESQEFGFPTYKVTTLETR